MRIDALNKISQMYQTTQPKKAAGPGTERRLDSLEISQTGKDFQVAKQAVASVPDIRQDRVDDIKARMASGMYSISGREVAEKLLYGRI